MIIFGWDLDGGCYPESIPGIEYNLGDCVVGPHGLLDLLEIRLGIGRPPSSPAIRIAQYLARLQAVDDGARFYSESLKTDPWETAGFLLRHRDELVMSGWDGKEVRSGSERLATFAEIEKQTDIRLAAGLAERIREILQALQELSPFTSKLDAGRMPALPAGIRLVTPREYLPWCWQEILLGLTRCGATIEEHTAKPAALSGDLAALQSAAMSHTQPELKGDGSFLVLEADDEIQAAEAVAAWLLAEPEKNQNVVIIRGDGASVLDQACSRLGQPRIGDADPSRWRSALQVLPLAIEILWSPVNPARLLEFLTLSQSPIPRSAAHFFKQALREEPGVGGEAWRQAWQTAEERWREKLTERDLTAEEVERKLADDLRAWKTWLSAGQFDPARGMPLQDAEQVCRHVQRWATRMGEARDDDLYRAAANHAGALGTALKESRLDSITKVQFERMIDATFEDGATLPGGGAEASLWTPVDHPGQVWAPCHTVLWWGFASRERVPVVRLWTDAERTDLRNAGVHLDSPGLSQLREGYSSRYPLLNAAERLILVKPNTIGGEPAVAHPLWHELGHWLQSCPERVHSKIFATAESIFSRAKSTFAGKELLMLPVQCGSPPEPRREWCIPAGKIQQRKTESFSSIDKLIRCPYAWVLSYSAEISRGALLDIPDDDQLVGTLAHAIIAKLFTEKASWKPAEAAARRALEIFDDEVARVAAPLLLPGRGLELRRYRDSVGKSVKALAKLLNDAGLQVVGCEIVRQAPFGPGMLEGRLDMLCKENGGPHVVIDLKWSKKGDYRRKEIEEGRPLQLAVYSRLQDHLSHDEPAAGYFMLRDARLFFTADGPFPEHTYVEGTDLESVWENANAAWQANLKDVCSGKAIARGVEKDENATAAPPPANPFMDIDPPCRFCDFANLCGIQE